MPVAETVDVQVVLEVGAMEETLTVVAEPADRQHVQRQPWTGRGSIEDRLAATDPRRPLQDHGARAGPRALGQPTTRSPVRADAHRRLCVSGHAQQPQRPADRRRPEHRHRQRQRGHRDLRPAVRSRAGVQGPDRDLRRAVRQHGRRRHQHQHQVRDQRLPWLGLLLRGAVQARRQRLLRQGSRPGRRRELVGPARLHDRWPGQPPGALQRQGQDVLHVRLRTHQGRPPALRRRRRQLGADREAAQRRLLRLRVQHHDLRPADARSRSAADSSRARRSPATSSRPTGSARSHGRSWTTTPCPRTRASPATSPTRRCRRRPTTTASPGAWTSGSAPTTGCSPVTAGTTATASTTSTWTRWRPVPGSSSSRGSSSSTTCTP